MDPAGDHGSSNSNHGNGTSKTTGGDVGRNNNSMEMDSSRTNADSETQDTTPSQYPASTTTTTATSHKKQDNIDGSSETEQTENSNCCSPGHSGDVQSATDLTPVLDSNDNENSNQDNGCLPTASTDISSTAEAPAPASTEDEEAQEEVCDREFVPLKVVWKKQKFDVNFALDDTVAQFKDHINTLTGVPPAMQKVMFKGLVNDDSKTLRHYNVTSGAKIMIVGSTVSDIIAVNTAPSAKELKESTAATGPGKEPLSKQKQHRKILDKGKPDDVLPASTGKESLPTVPLTGMLNKSGGKVRLTFKMEADQLWIGTKERTEKLPMSSIKSVTSEPIEDHKEYHMLALQLGPTEASRYWIYWVPAQFIDAIKDAILGKWAFF